MPAHKLKRLSDRHHAAIRLKIEGHSCREIAEIVGVDLRTVYLWFSDPLVKAELEKQRSRVFDLFATKLVDTGMQALRRLEELADMELDAANVTVEQRLEIVREILDRIPMTSKQQHRTPSQPTPLPPPDNMSDEELLREFRAVAGELPPGVIEGVMSGNGTS